MRHRFDWRGLLVIIIVLGALVYVGVAIAMLIADLRPLLTAR